MAGTVVWRGDAPAVAGTVLLTVSGTLTAGNIFTVTINTKQISFTTTTNVIADAVAGILAALNAAVATIPEFAEFTWAAVSPVITGTNTMGGRPWTISTGVSGGGGTPALGATTGVTPSGPADWANPANWDTGAVPNTGDDVIIPPGSSSILWGLAASHVALNSFTVQPGYTGWIGLPRNNPAGYIEYRQQYLQIGPATCTINQRDIDSPAQSLSSRIKLDFGSVQVACKVCGMGAPADSGQAAFSFTGTHASNTLTVLGGSVNVATGPGETAVIATLRIASTGGGKSDASVRCGSGVTLTTVDQRDGVLQTETAVTTYKGTGGEWLCLGGAVTTMRLRGSTCRYYGAGTITNLYVYDGGVIDMSRGIVARAVTNTTLYKGATVTDPQATVASWSITLAGCAISDVSLSVGDDRALAIT